MGGKSVVATKGLPVMDGRDGTLMKDRIWWAAG